MAAARPALLALLGGVLVATLGAVGVFTSGEPHLALDALDAWLVVYAAGFAVALAAIPFILRVHFTSRTEDDERLWELSLTSWGAITIGLTIVLAVAGFVAGFDPVGAAGALVLVGLGACGIVIGGLLLLVLGTG